MKQMLFPDPASNGPSNDTGDSRTWPRRWNNWSSRRSSTTSPQGQVHVPAGATQPPPHCPPPPPHCDTSHDFAVNGEADTSPLANPPSTSTTLHKPFRGQQSVKCGEKKKISFDLYFMSLIKGWHAVLLQWFELSLRHPSPRGTSGPRSTSPQQAWPSWHRQSLQFQFAAQPCELFLFNRHLNELPCV